VIKFKNIENYVDSERIQNIDSQTLKSYIATPLAKEFGVSSQSMEIALGDIDYFKEQYKGNISLIIKIL